MKENQLIEEFAEDISEESGKKKSLQYSLIAKIIILCAILSLVFLEIDFNEFIERLKSIKTIYIIFSFLALFSAQFLSALRMRYYFSNAGYKIHSFFSVALYFTGALYNMILPGGISGDGYKAYFFKKYMQIPLKTSIRLMLSERANGLFFLCIYAIILGFMGNIRYEVPYSNILLILAFFVLIPAYLVSIKFILREKPATAIGASRFSLVSQACVALSAYFLLIGMGTNGSTADYLAVFMISCVVSIVPIFIGSAGSRELTFFYAAQYSSSLDKELGIALALAFFVIYVTTSLIGLVFVTKVKNLPKLSDDNTTY